MKIYLASSWRNTQQPAVLAALRAAGHECYDFHNPAPGNNGFGWRQVHPDPPPWSAAETIKVLNSPRAIEGYNLDFNAMQWADAIVMLQPCGRSAALELGWGCGKKLTIALLVSGQEPELMLKMADHLCSSVGEVVELLAIPSIIETSRGRVAALEIVRRIQKDLCGRSGFSFDDLDDETISELTEKWVQIVMAGN